MRSFSKTKLVPDVIPTLCSMTTAAICAVPITGSLSEALNKAAAKAGKKYKCVNHAKC